MAIYSSGSTVGWRYVVEVTFGTTPASGWKYLRCKTSKMTLKKDTYTSDEIRSDRAVTDLRHGMRKVEGALDGELSLGAFDDLLMWALQDSATASGSMMTGTTLKTFSLEQQFTDLPQYRVFAGCAVSKLKVSAKPGSLVEVSFDIIGKDSPAISGTPAAGSTTAAPTNSPLSYANGSIYEGGTVIAYVTGVDFELDNGLGTVGVIGSDTTPDIFNGRSTIKGTVTALFKDAIMLNKFMNETESSLQLTFTDLSAPTTGYTFTMPRLKYTGGDIAPPKDGATIITLPFEAIFTPNISCVANTNMAVSAQVGPGSATFTKTGGTSFITQGFKIGQMLTTKNLTTGANNSDWLITAVAADAITVQVPTGFSTTLQAAGAPGAGAGDMSVTGHNLSIVKF